MIKEGECFKINSKSQYNDNNNEDWENLNKILIIYCFTITKRFLLL